MSNKLNPKTKQSYTVNKNIGSTMVEPINKMNPNHYPNPNSSYTLSLTLTLTLNQTPAVALNIIWILPQILALILMLTLIQTLALNISLNLHESTVLTLSKTM